MRAGDNPFAVDRVLTVRYHLLETNWGQLLSDLRSFDFRAAIVGPQGSGKTTLQEDLEERLIAQGFLSLRMKIEYGQRRVKRSVLRETFSRLDHRHIVFVDGAEQLGCVSWWAIQRRALGIGGLIVTSHRAGLLPTLIRCRTSPELLRLILSELLGSQLRDIEDTVEQVYSKHQGNLRDALREYYDIYAARRNSGQDIVASLPGCCGRQ